MRYTLNQLQIFAQVYINQSVTKASEELHLTQPAVSIQLKNFQDQFDIPLIEHIGRKIHITDFGHEVYKSCHKILEEVQQLESKRNAYLGLLVGQMRISVASTGKYVIPYFLSEFIQAHPGIELKMDVTNKSKVIESLKENEVDFALVSVLPEGMNVENISLMENKLYLVGSAEKALMHEIKKSGDLHKVPLIFRENGSATRKTMEEYLTSQNIPTSKRIELTSNEAVKQAVMSGLGYSIMPLIGLRNELNNGQLSIIPIKSLPITTSWNLIWLKGKELSPVALTYLEFIRKEKTRIIEEVFGWHDKAI